MAKLLVGVHRSLFKHETIRQACSRRRSDEVAEAVESTGSGSVATFSSGGSKDAKANAPRAPTGGCQGGFMFFPNEELSGACASLQHYANHFNDSDRLIPNFPKYKWC